jgi:hypothetical protein
MKEISLSELKERLTYREGEWVLRWRIPPCSNMHEDEIAGYVHSRGYRIIKINKVQYKAHRILYRLYHNLEELDRKIQIDHVDGNKVNNSPENLRLANSNQNQYNTKRQSNNKSGHKNILKVRWSSKGKEHFYWRVDIRHANGRYVKDFQYEEPLPEYIIEHSREMRKQLHGEYSNE